MHMSVMSDAHDEVGSLWGATPLRGAAASSRGVLVVVVLSRPMYGFARTLQGIDESARRRGWETAISWVGRSGASSVAEVAAELRSSRLRGLIALAPDAELEQGLAELAPELPAIVVGAEESAVLPVVVAGHRAGARCATEHLLSGVDCTVWHVGGPEGWPEARERERGWRDALESRGMWQPPVIRGDWSPRSGYAAGEILLHEPGVDAVFVANDQMAFGLCRAFAEGGRSVPRDVRVAGFDDVPVAAYATPSLTTVRQDHTAWGECAIDVLTRLIAGGPDAAGPRAHHSIPELVVRGSTKPERGYDFGGFWRGGV